jgi:hypothetical protein
MHVPKLVTIQSGVACIMRGMPFITKQAQIPRHWDSAKCGHLLLQCKVAHHEDMVLDVSWAHRATGSSTLDPVGSWKPVALANTINPNT